MGLMMEVREQNETRPVSRSEYAKRIKELMRDWTANTLALARELDKARQTFAPNPKRPKDRPGFARWAMKETGLSRGQITILVLIHRRFGDKPSAPRLSTNVMRMLITRDVPESARQEVLDRTGKGEHVSVPDVRKIVKAHALPTAKEANKQAKEEGRPVYARDGNIYFGTDAMKAKEGEDRRTTVYGVRKALDTLGAINLTGKEFLAYALPHQLWDNQEAAVIKRALRWLTMLDIAWDERE